jgi:hypothetical protein
MTSMYVPLYVPLYLTRLTDHVLAFPRLPRCENSDSFGLAFV